MFDLRSEPLRGVIGDPGWLALPGLEALGRAVRGEAASPPMHHLIGLRPTEAGLGRATFTLPVTRWLEDGLGIVEAGAYPVVADAALSTALYTGMPPGRVVTTTVLTMLYVRPITRQTTHINARAQGVHVGREVGVSECRIEDQFGRLLAFGSTRCVFRDVPLDPDAQPLAAPEAVTEPPDPYLRAVPPDSYWPVSAHEGRAPIEVQRAAIAGELPRGPRFELTGMVPVSIEPGVFSGTGIASPWLSAGTPFMYGGMIAWLCDATLTAAMWSTLAPGEALAVLDMEVRFLRPVPLDDSTLTASGQVVHSGRSVRVAEATLAGADGRPVAMATGSGMVLPGGLTAFFRGSPPEEIVGV